MGHNMNKNRKEQFLYKSLLIFSGICLGASLLFLYFLGLKSKILKTEEFNVFSFLIILVPLVTHIYLWGKFCEYQKLKVLSIVLRLLAVLSGVIIVVMTIAYLCGAKLIV